MPNAIKVDPRRSFASSLSSRESFDEAVETKIKKTESGQRNVTTKSRAESYDNFEPHSLASLSYSQYEEVYGDKLGTFKRVLVIDNKKRMEQSKRIVTHMDRCSSPPLGCAL